MLYAMNFFITDQLLLVTKSLACASSIPLAAAKFKTPGNPAADCCASHPATLLHCLGYLS